MNHFTVQDSVAFDTCLTSRDLLDQVPRCSHHPKDPLPMSGHSSCLPPPPPAPGHQHPALCLCGFTFWTFHKNAFIQFVAFGVWLLSLSVFSRVTRIVAIFLWAESSVCPLIHPQGPAPQPLAVQNKRRSTRGWWPSQGRSDRAGPTAPARTSCLHGPRSRAPGRGGGRVCPG